MKTEVPYKVLAKTYLKLLNSIVLKSLLKSFTYWEIYSKNQKPSNLSIIATPRARSQSKIPVPKSARKSSEEKPRRQPPSYSTTNTPYKRLTSAPPTSSQRNSPKNLFSKLKTELKEKAQGKKTTDPGTRLYNQAKTLQEKRQKMKMLYEKHYPFSPRIQNNTNKWLNQRHQRKAFSAYDQVAVVSSSAAVCSSATVFNFTKHTGSNIKDMLSPKPFADLNSKPSKPKPFIPLLPTECFTKENGVN